MATFTNARTVKTHTQTPYPDSIGGITTPSTQVQFRLPDQFQWNDRGAATAQGGVSHNDTIIVRTHLGKLGLGYKGYKNTRGRVS